MSVVLDVQPDTGYEPSDAEMIEYGKWLGMELPEDMPLIWIAREGLKAPLPDNWKACKSEKGELYYFNFKTGQSIWDHPSDEHYRELLKNEKEKLKAKGAPSEEPEPAAAEVSPSGRAGKTGKKKKAKSTDVLNSPVSAAKPQEEMKRSAVVVQQVQPVQLAQAIQPKKEIPGPLKLTSLAVDPTKSDRNGKGRISSPEFQSTTSQSDSSLASEPPKTLRVDEPEAIPLPTKVVAGGGVNGLRALDKLTSPSSAASAASPSATAKAAVLFAKEQKALADQQLAKEMDVYKAEQKKMLQSKVDAQVAKDLESYRAEQRAGQQAQIDQQVVEELDAYTAEQQAALRKRKKEVDADVAEELKQCRERASEEKQKRRGSTEKEIADAVSAESEQLGQELEQKLLELRQEYERKRVAEADRLREKHKAQLDHDRRKIEAEVAQTLEAFTREKRQESEIKKEAQSQALQEAGKSVADLKQVSGAFLHQYEEALAAFTTAVQQSQSVLDQVGLQKQQELQDDLDAKLGRLSAEHEEQVRQEELRAKEEVEALREKHASEVEALKQSQRQELQQLQNDFSEERSKSQKAMVSKEHDQFLETLTGIKEAQAKELEILKQQLKEKAQEELNDIMQELAAERQSRRRSSSALRFAQSQEPSPHPGTRSRSASAIDEDEHGEKSKAVPPHLDGKLLARPLQDGNGAMTPGAAAQVQQPDIKTLITEALREMFAGSPFILASPGQGGEAQTAPATPAAAAVSSPSKTTVDQRSPGALAKQPPPSSGSLNRTANTLNLPLSFQEQRNLVEGERRRLQEGRRNVELQRQSLEDRKQQLRRTRHQWKQDVLAAKAEGIRSSSKRGQLLNKVRDSLEEQARGLDHDAMILHDSQEWLRSKEERLMLLERQIEEQERLKNRSGADASALNNWSVDTAALMTGYFKPQRYSAVVPEVPFHRDVLPRSSFAGGGALPVSSYTTSPVLSKALSRIERRLDEVTSIIHLQQQQAASLGAVTPYSHSGRRHTTTSPAIREPPPARTRRASRSQSKPDVLRRETHLDQWQGPGL